jgi:hypothetical protein
MYEKQHIVPDLLVDLCIRIEILILTVDDGQRTVLFQRLSAEGEECSPQKEANDRSSGE